MGHKITVIGLGAGELEQLTLGVYKMLINTPHVYLRTKEHPVIEQLEREGLQYTSFDHIYENHDQFEQVYEEIVKVLLDKALKEDIVYAVPGHPLVAERTVQLLLQQNIVEVEIAGGQSFLDPLFASVRIDPIEGFQLVDATSFVLDEIELRHHLIFGQVYDSFIASEVKLSLMEVLPDDYEVYIVTAAGTSFESVKKVQLYELDRQTELNNLTSVYVPPVQDKEVLYGQFHALRQIIRELRGPNGCPWDKEQTHQSLKKYLIEEAYELLEAIDEEDDDHIIEELGDVLLQVMLHAQIGEDEGWFSIDDVIRSISAKMVRRHPHVFQNVQVSGAEEVVANWEEIKKQEKVDKPKSVLSDIPKSLPQLLQAYEIQKQAAKVGFDWKEVEPMMEKVREEWEEFCQEARNMNQQEMLQEFGDILFALVNVARFYKLNPEEAVHATNRKFMKRFTYIETHVAQTGKAWEEFTLEELDHIWEEAKKEESH
ncbi:nucleoside triphosphate pyrophosphohydrolase [Ectobacillus sp. JY-23]|uniref:nucleoside triphosphate pyrophosphohydrolase n=1 Tax=Ectobacillus sp. JY-23 TaxID=2933872 RepID=UPI001FF2351F|nr:nucleoside triphosphate pyrophosphohydrolase [Ectobacillus sp. JY-23]UOY91425.1 nucleoside triphosphate pyrophosphohydrolase [Ectobacillus sp. JY-23]